MIRTLRSNEIIELHGGKLRMPQENEELAVLEFLKSQYQQETLDYPHQAPDFNSNAALFGAKIIYISTQLYVFRDSEAHLLSTLIPVFAHNMNASSILSADLCLRFLPQVVIELKNADKEDKLIKILENILETWHYSAIGYQLSKTTSDFNNVLKNQCIRQLYIDRIISRKCMDLAILPQWNSFVSGDLGIFASNLWPEFHKHK